MGVQEEDAQAQDPIDLLVVFQKNLELVQEAGMRQHKLEERRMQAKGTEVAADAATTLTAVKAKNGDAPVHWSRWCECRHHQCPCAIRQTAAHGRPTHNVAEESATEQFLVDSRRSIWRRPLLDWRRHEHGFVSDVAVATRPSRADGAAHRAAAPNQHFLSRRIFALAGVSQRRP